MEYWYESVANHMLHSESTQRKYYVAAQAESMAAHSSSLIWQHIG